MNVCSAALDEPSIADEIAGDHFGNGSFARGLVNRALRPPRLRMTPALRAVSSQLKKRDVAADHHFVETPPPRLFIPPRNVLTGGITVFDESPELTVEWEGKHHSHFKSPEEAGDFVADIITERVCVTVDYLGDRCIGSSCFSLDAEGVTSETLRDSLAGLRGGNIRSERFLWSGQVNAKRN